MLIEKLNVFVNIFRAEVIFHQDYCLVFLSWVNRRSSLIQKSLEIVCHTGFLFPCFFLGDLRNFLFFFFGFFFFFRLFNFFLNFFFGLFFELRKRFFLLNLFYLRIFFLLFKFFLSLNNRGFWLFYNSNKVFEIRGRVLFDHRFKVVLRFIEIEWKLLKSFFNFLVCLAADCNSFILSNINIG